jgi:hypothetical protein
MNSSTQTTANPLGWKRTSQQTLPCYPQNIMCGRYTQGDPSPLKRRFGLEEFAETTITPRFNVAPTQDIPIVVERPKGRELRMAHWGFVPFSMESTRAPPDADANKKSTRPPPINARAETVGTSGMFRSYLAKANYRRRGDRWLPADSDNHIELRATAPLPSLRQ